MKKYCLLIVLLSLLEIFLLTSCRTTKQENKQIFTQPDTSFLNKPEIIFSNLKNNEFKFEWLKIKFEAKLTTDDIEQSFSGQFRIRKDSIIWLSLTLFGMEGLRMKMNNDSVWLINRIESTYFIGDFKLINRVINTNVDFDMLQAFITGNDFKYYETSQFKATFDEKEKMYKLSTVNRRKLKKNLPENISNPFTEDILYDPSINKIKHVKINFFKENRKFDVSYLSFMKINEQLFPSDIDVYIKIKDKPEPVNEKKIKLNIKYNSVIVNEPQEFPFTIPKKYEKMY